MTGRERIRCAIRHQETDRVPIDFGATPVTGIAASIVAALRQELQLDTPGTPVKVIEPGQFLGEIADDLKERVGIDTVALWSCTNTFGFRNENWKRWTMFDGTEVIVPELFNTVPEKNGDIMQYPQGDKSVSPCSRMPKDGFYFDSIIRQKPIDDAKLNPEDNVEDYSVLSDEALSHFEEQAAVLYKNTDLALVANIGGTAFGDVGRLPGNALKDPGGIRDIEEWYISILTRKDYIKEVFARQCEIALENMKLFYQAVGNKIEVVYISGTDFGTQNAPFISSETYRELYMPYQKKLNDWVHESTDWKTFMHSCGAIEPLIPDFIEAGWDILNPVQISAAGMDAESLKNKYGDKITFWGGGVDTQQTLPFGTPEEVYDHIKEQIKIFSKGGGFVFNSIHNVQAQTPIENMVAMFNALKRETRMI
jgi:Uroporphyrinogen decarboxylase (URO-D)